MSSATWQKRSAIGSEVLPRTLVTQASLTILHTASNQVAMGLYEQLWRLGHESLFLLGSQLSFGLSPLW